MRKSVEIKLEDRGQDLTFRIEEMPATRLESWIIRAVLLLAGSGLADSPGKFDLKEAGAFLAEKGLSALGRVDYEQAKPLLDELMGCCCRVIGKAEERCTPANIDDHIKDVGNLFRLKAEALKVNLGFLSGGLGNLFSSPEKPDSEPK